VLGREAEGIPDFVFGWDGAHDPMRNVVGKVEGMNLQYQVGCSVIIEALAIRLKFPFIFLGS
jgi:hypothetical protein